MLCQKGIDVLFPKEGELCTSGVRHCLSNLGELPCEVHTYTERSPLPSDILTLDHHKAHSCIIILFLKYFLT